MAETTKTIVEYFAEHERYRCGYCGNTDTNFSHGMWAHIMNVQDYQDLLDRGWRRSGKYTYKPTMNMTCCPQYTIRCEVLDFKLRKSHKKVLKKVNKYLIQGIKPSKHEEELDEELPQPMAATDDQQAIQAKSQKLISDGPLEVVHTASAGQAEDEQGTSKVKPKGGRGLGNLFTAVVNRVATRFTTAKVATRFTTAVNKFPSPLPPDRTTNTVKPIDSTKQGRKSNPVAGADPSKPPCKKAKDIRRERKLTKLAAKGLKPEASEQSCGSSKHQESKTLEDFLNEPLKAENCAHKLEIRLVRSNPQSPEFRDSIVESHSVYHRYQMAIHGDPSDKPVMKQYKRFLVDSPLEEEYEEGGLPSGYGSFHQQYILDGKIICVGVLDVLPSLVSSKYLYYDPDYSFLSLGTFSALQEIAFVRSLHKHSQKMLYYYMGFYIHSCPKMKYKGQYFPSFLLCPETYTWHAVETCAPKLDQKKYSRFADSDQVDALGNIDLSSVLILFSRQLMTYEIYKALSRGANDDEDEVKEYANFVGMKCATRMLLFRK